MLSLFGFPASLTLGRIEGKEEGERGEEEEREGRGGFIINIILGILTHQGLLLSVSWNLDDNKSPQFFNALGLFQ